MKNKRQIRVRVAVAMSGGVDSSVAALLLKKQGYSVVGLTMQLVSCGAEKVSGCCGLEAVNSAKKVCQELNIPHYVVNFRASFQKKVIDDFCRQYLKGRTPNPCVACNKYIKFDLLLKRAREIGADYLATGHYARLRQNKLLKGKDKQKDQSYFLFCLNQNQLRYILFPLGDLTKKEVRQIAKKAKLAAAKRPESQEICFVPNNNYRQFLKENCSSATKSGPILDTKGKILGQHRGIAFYTIGQRKGLGISSPQPLYVVKIDAKKNALIVGSEKDLYRKECLVKNVNWIAGQSSRLPLEVMVKIRYKHQPAQAKIIYGYCSCEQPVIRKKKRKFKELVMIKFRKPQRAITPGQSAVFYSGQEVLGGGVIV